MFAYIKLKLKSHALEAKVARRDEIKYRDQARVLFASVQRAEVRDEDGLETDYRSKIVESVVRMRQMRLDFYEHRTRHLRREVRASLIGYGFLRGKDYKTMEVKTYSYPDWDRVGEFIAIFSTAESKNENLQRFAEWSDKADNVLKAEFQKRAKEPRVPKVRRRRVIDHLVRATARDRKMSLRDVLVRAGVPKTEWNDIVIGAKPFTNEHASLFSAALGVHPDLLMKVEQTYQESPLAAETMMLTKAPGQQAQVS